MLSERVETIDRAFYLRRIAAAEAHRKRVVADSDAYRLVHGEGDQLPGLVIDRYGDYFTLQTLDQGMDRAKAEIVSCLEELFAPKGIAERNDVAVRKREALPLQSGVLAGEVPETVAVRMNGLKLHADLLHGQKTGIFLDQRENYIAAARYGRGRALDCFTSTGGFALHLARALRKRGGGGQFGSEPARRPDELRRQRDRQCRASRGRCVRTAGRVCDPRTGVLISWSWILRRSRNRAKAWKRRSRGYRRD